MGEFIFDILGADTERGRTVIESAGGLGRLAGRTTGDHHHLCRMGPAAATRLSAAIELGRRTTAPETPSPEAMTTARKAGAYLIAHHGSGPVEQMGILAVNARHGLVRDIVLTRGTVDETLAEPRDIFRAAMLDSAAGLIMWHNHPSGIPTPTEDDVALTSRVCDAGAMIGIELIDHIIVTATTYYSFKEQGRL